MARLPLSGSDPVFDSYIWDSPKYINCCNCYDYALSDCHKRFQKSTPGDNSRKNWKRNLGLSASAHDKKDFIQRVQDDNPKTVYRTNIHERCKLGYYKIMAFIAPGDDFHWYRQNGQLRYRIRQGDTIENIARMFKTSLNNVKEALSNASKPLGKDDGLFTDQSQLDKTARSGGILLTPFVGKVIQIRCNIWSHKRGWGEGPLVTDASGNLITNPLKANRNYGMLNYSTFISAFCVKKGKVQTGMSVTPNSIRKSIRSSRVSKSIPNIL